VVLMAFTVLALVVATAMAMAAAVENMSVRLL
jgi:hypothetical protein